MSALAPLQNLPVGFWRFFKGLVLWVVTSDVILRFCKGIGLRKVKLKAFAKHDFWRKKGVG
jgi:hypothetical protein